MIAISLPFRIDGYGRVATTSDMYKVYADRVRSLVSTHAGERLMSPLYGASVTQSLYDAVGIVPDLIEVDVADAFQRWLPDLTFVGVTLDYEDEVNGEVRVTVEYEVPNLDTQQQQSVDVTIALN